MKQKNGMEEQNQVRLLSLIGYYFKRGWYTLRYRVGKVFVLFSPMQEVYHAQYRQARHDLDVERCSEKHLPVACKVLEF